MANFKVDAYNPDRTEVEQQYSLTFTDTAPAAPVAANELTSAGTITSGALPALSAWSSGTAKQNPTTVTTPARDVTVFVEVTSDGTNNAGTCAIAISADDATYTTIGTVSIPAAVNNLGVVTEVVPVRLPKAWFIKLTFTATRITVAASKYY
jgi:hypothetical protein